MCELAQGHKWECNEMMLHIHFGHCLASSDLSDKLEHAEQLHPVLALPPSSSDIFEVRQAPPAAHNKLFCPIWLIGSYFMRLLKLLSCPKLCS